MRNDFEVQKETARVQYDNAWQKIEYAMNQKQKNCCISNFSLCPPVAFGLAEKGFDVRIVRYDDDSKSINEISWEHRKEGMGGIVTIDDKTELNIPDEVEPDIMDTYYWDMEMIKLYDTHLEPKSCRFGHLPTEVVFMLVKEGCDVRTTLSPDHYETNEISCEHINEGKRGTLTTVYYVEWNSQPNEGESENTESVE